MYRISAHHSGPLKVPRVTVNTASAKVKYQVQSSDNATTRVIAGYEVIRFGVPMIGVYVNAGRGRGVTISPAVPGDQYRITAWALGNGARSETPTEAGAITGEASELHSL